jgi:ATP-dependent helicase HrpA
MALPLIRYPDLPISSRRDEIVQTIRDSQVLVLAGETGSGKTTQLPKMCLEVLHDLPGMIGCTQPRRVAAMSVSKRVAEELNVRWGGMVGCKMRFNDDTSRETKVKFMTDGILLAEIQSDPLLRNYSAIIVDEAHERSLNIDFLLGYLKRLLPQRTDLKVIITSATIDTQAFSEAFGGAPIIEVSGRTYPVEIRYAPPFADDDDDQSLMDAVLDAIEAIVHDPQDGDALVFLPTEREIRDCVDLLSGRIGGAAEVLPLFGRLSSQDQQRVFQPGRKRRVVVSTNVAETSVTIPRIRFVIDSGLARVSRYNPRTRTKRLPIEAISQSSANQRAGRAGRVQAGVCIRLYEEEDYLKRSKFTQPEIQRANLAEVILRMKAIRLGAIEDFPFIQPPTAASIRTGYELLRELGSLDDTHELTELGQEMARLPVDPTLGRMLLQARKEGCLPDMLVLAAGLSVPDPRERPEQGREQAAAAHKAFASPDSDFMSLLKIWQQAPEQRTNNALRRYCKGRYLSFLRMKEWYDLWRQLSEMFSAELRNHEALSAEANQAALHRSILTGHLGHIAKKHERNLYKGANNRELTVFPGSNLYERREKSAPKGTEDKSKQPAWIVAGEIVQTSQLFARSLAKIDPEWIAELGAHLVEHKYGDPHWSPKAGRVLVTQRFIVHGLEVTRRLVDFGKIDPHEATLLFIRGALLETPLQLKHRFYQHNQTLRQKIETALTRVRSSKAFAVEEHLFMFYAERLQHCSSIHDLNRIMTERTKTEPAYLCATEEQLTGGEDIAEDLKMFPDQVKMANAVLPVNYVYRPGEDNDGVTVSVPLPVAQQLSAAQVQWIVPGLREELCLILLRALPRPKRRDLMPLEPKARELAQQWQPGAGSFLGALAVAIGQRFGVEVSEADWPADSIPPHLQPRLKVVDEKKQTVALSRDLKEVQQSVKQALPKSNAWELAVKATERYALRSWSFGDVPESIVVENIAGAPWLGYPGLELDGYGVNLRLHKTPQEAASGMAKAIRQLAEWAMGKDLAWLQKELRHLTPTAAPKPKSSPGLTSLSALSALGTVKTAPSASPPSALQDQAYHHILKHALQMTAPYTQPRFDAMCQKATKELPLLVARVKDLLGQSERLRAAILNSKYRYTGIEADVARLLPTNVLETTSYAQLQHLPRYLNAVAKRAERASYNPAKDKEKALQLADYDHWRDYVKAADAETFRWMLEEYRVSIFAPELGTAQSVSVKKLEALMQ